MVSGVNWSFFFCLDNRASGGAYNELDIPEVTPGAIPPNHISTYQGITAYQVDYFATPSPAYDDGNVHTMTWNWQRNYIDFYVDGVMIHGQRPHGSEGK